MSVTIIHIVLALTPFIAVGIVYLACRLNSEDSKSLLQSMRAKHAIKMKYQKADELSRD